MKIVFDQHVPMGMVRVFKSLGDEPRFRREGIAIESARDYAPNPADPDYQAQNDVPWLQRFANAGGKVVVTGDVKTRENPHELQALLKLGFIVIFFEPKWARWDFYKKSSLLLHYWPSIIKKVKKAKKGEFWCIPSVWRDDGVLRSVPTRRKKVSKTNPDAPRPKRKDANPSKGSAKSKTSKSKSSKTAKSFMDEKQGLLNFWDQPSIQRRSS